MWSVGQGCTLSTQIWNFGGHIKNLVNSTYSSSFRPNFCASLFSTELTLCQVVCCYLHLPAHGFFLTSTICWTSYSWPNTWTCTLPVKKNLLYRFLDFQSFCPIFCDFLHCCSQNSSFLNTKGCNACIFRNMKFETISDSFCGSWSLLMAPVNGDSNIVVYSKAHTQAALPT